MNAWASKDAAIASTRSLFVKGWLRNFNVWVPCRIQGMPRFAPIPEGKISVTFNPVRPSPSFTLSVPVEAVMVEHKLFRHSIPLNCLPPILNLLAGRDSVKWLESGETRKPAIVDSGK